jgi:hypothetical protein
MISIQFVRGHSIRIKEKIIMSNSENSNSCLLNTLCDNLDEMVTIYTEGCSQVNGITGLLVSVSCDACKLVTPCCGRRAGTITVIPIDQIAAVTICNTSV